jgi:hypothetical protein
MALQAAFNPFFLVTAVMSASLFGVVLTLLPIDREAPRPRW